VVLLPEAEDVRIEPKRLLLIVHHDAGELDPHREPPRSSAASLSESRARRFSKTAERPRERAWRQAPQQGEAARGQCLAPLARRAHDRPDASTVSRRRLAEASGEQGTEAAQTRESDLEANLGHRVLARGEQLLGQVEPRSNAELMRCQADDGLELPDEVKGRQLHLAREIGDRRSGFPQLRQEISSPTESPEALRSEQHGLTPV